MIFLVKLFQKMIFILGSIFLESFISNDILIMCFVIKFSPHIMMTKHFDIPVEFIDVFFKYCLNLILCFIFIKAFAFMYDDAARDNQ